MNCCTPAWNYRALSTITLPLCTSAAPPDGGKYSQTRSALCKLDLLLGMRRPAAMNASHLAARACTRMRSEVTALNVRMTAQNRPMLTSCTWSAPLNAASAPRRVRTNILLLGAGRNCGAFPRHSSSLHRRSNARSKARSKARSVPILSRGCSVSVRSGAFCEREEV